jgi:hypothetical protein
MACIVKYFQFVAFILLFAFSGLNSADVKAQESKGKSICIAFYNVENLYDTIDDPMTDDAEFTPSGPGKWDSRRYQEKLTHLAKVISQIGDENVEGTPAMIGLAEVENKQVVEDLVNTPPLDKKGYKVIHYDSPDKRGIDVAFLYQPKVFKYKESKTILLKIQGKDDFYTRDILQVSGTIKGQPFYILVNHWPSRSKGQKESAPLRNAAADLCLATVQNIQSVQPDAGVIIMGDLNDDPVDESLMSHLKVKTNPDSVATGDLYNPMWQLFKDGKGSLEYKGIWNLFDQVVVSSTLLDKSRHGFHFSKANVFKRDWLVEAGGKYEGYPFRTYAGTNYLGGYSDHLPVYIYLDRK